MHPDWITWQLCDSAFPTGAFAHSAGLEAAWQAGEVRDAEGLAQWIVAALEQAGTSTIPLVRAAWEGARPLEELDALCESFLLNHVANRASRAQGQALLMACTRTFESGAVRRVADGVRKGKLHAHYAPLLGALCRALGVPRKRACDLFLFLALRGAVSTAVRLGIVGPLQGQGLQHHLAAAASAGAVVERGMAIPPDAVVQTAPLLDLLQGTQDRLYSRLFVS